MNQANNIHVEIIGQEIERSTNDAKDFEPERQNQIEIIKALIKL